MEKVKRAKIIWLAAAVVSAGLCIAAVSLMFSYGFRGMFVHLAVCIPFALHGFWGVPVYVYNFFKSRLFERIVAFLNDKESLELNELANGIGLKSCAVKPLLQKCIKKRYLKDFKIEGECLVKIK
jgi:hypothetical protein